MEELIETVKSSGAGEEGKEERRKQGGKK